MKESSIKSVVIVGGGSAGWMTAAALIKAAPQGLSITLVESEQIGTVGVGEATIPPIQEFNKSLGLNENEFIKETQGTFKLGIEFVNWGQKDHRYFHPFGSFGANFDSIPLFQYWLKNRENGNSEPLDAYSIAYELAKKNKFDQPLTDTRSIMSTFDYAYHFDAGLYAKFLRTRAEKMGVKRIEGIVSRVEVDRPKDTIDYIELKDGSKIAGDFFIDCSGFRGVLIDQALHTGYIDWSHWLPCDRAVAMPCEHGGELSPFTRSTAHEAGWQWRIPLQHRVGNGHVYCSKYISDDEALNTLQNNLEGAPLGEPNFLKFRTGRRNMFWKGNCLAVGLAAGFLEPLESTSLHFIQSSIQRFLGLWPASKNDLLSANEFNKLTAEEYDISKDFLIAHYHLNTRTEDFWQLCRYMDIPDSLRARLNLYRETGRLVNSEHLLFKNVNWLAILAGQQEIPKTYSSLVDNRVHVDYQGILKQIRNAVKQAANYAPSHSEYIAGNCRANK